MAWQWLVRSWVQQIARQQLEQVVSQAVHQGSQSREKDAGPTQEGPSPQSERLVSPEILVTFALGAESGGLVDLMSGTVQTRGEGFTLHQGTLQKRRIALLETGVGLPAGTKGLRAVLQSFRPQWVIAAGFSGALVPNIKLHDIVMATHVLNEKREEFSIGLSISQEEKERFPFLHAGKLLTVDRIIRLPSEKERLGKEFNAMAVDMETWGVAEICMKEKIRFLAVRVISDRMQDELPKEIQHLVAKKSTAGRLGSALGAIWNRPGSVKDMWNLRETALVASDRLADYLKGVIGQLP